MKSFFLFPLAFLVFAGALTLTGCKKDKDSADAYKYEAQHLNLPAQPYNYSNPVLPNHMQGVQVLLQQKVSDRGATLGRVLFYDPKLSLNNKIACASCHHQDKGFADPVKFSIGFDEGLTKRNANSIINPIESAAFFWDGRETDLKKMVLAPIKNHIEMGMDNFDALEKKLAGLDYYQPLFQDAFGDTEVTRERIGEALSQFLNSMVSASSKFDSSNPGGWGSVGNTLVFNEQEKKGMDLFFGKAQCANCHNPVRFNVFGFGETWADIGLEVTYSDKGLGENVAGEDGKFKIPSLRNIAQSAPYMHDGRFATLLEVVNHYNDNIQASPNLHWTLSGGTNSPLRLGLSETEKEDLIAFLGTLSDETYMNDPKYSNPFE